MRDLVAESSTISRKFLSEPISSDSLRWIPSARRTRAAETDPWELMASFFLEPVGRELQRTAVLRHGADDLIRGAIWEQCFDLERDRDLSSHLPSQVRDHLVGDAARVTTDTRGIKLDGTVEPVWKLRAAAAAAPVAPGRRSRPGLRRRHSQLAITTAPCGRDRRSRPPILPPRHVRLHQQPGLSVGKRHDLPRRAVPGSVPRPSS